MCGGKLIVGSHIIRETGNWKEGCFHINLSYSSSDWVKLGLSQYIMDISSQKREKLSRRCENLHNEMQEEMTKAMQNMETQNKNREISYAHDLTMARRKYEVTKSHVNILNSKLGMKLIGWIRKMICLKNMKSHPN